MQTSLWASFITNIDQMNPKYKRNFLAVRTLEKILAYW